MPDPALGTHVIDVELTHCDLLQEMPPTLTSGLRSDTPKLVPETVVVEPAVVGEFLRTTSVTTGESNVNPSPEPDWPRTETDVLNPVPAPAGTPQRMAVSDSQSIERQDEPASLTVGVISADPKLTPCTVTVAAADSGAFAGACEVTTGAS